MTQTRKPFIVGIGGTQRAGSSSELALRYCLSAAEKAGAETDIICGAALELPLFDPGVTHRTPATLRLIQALRRADGVVIATPSYHGGMSGMIKNAIDYTEDMREDARSYFDGRAVGCIVCAAGDQALGSGLMGLRMVVHALRGWPTPYAATIKSNEKPFIDGQPAKREVAQALEIVASQVVDFARMAMASRVEDASPRLVVSN
ncbi:NAD(P)H-dependent oxidoreductase [Rhizobium sp. XQZ8]|uniref:NADPH-dependent FMN reductase n=1 Tax=Rhizobium populisoli TaxID=2859785 RepID=UPI001C66F49E|nr:NAD(P)H-dependent oxidoreductase [Rhizobium populisoli]MBW6422537.1 NAD(P)H-dependent oxidoreductase [Rhizobium populisoli]